MITVKAHNPHKAKKPRSPKQKAATKRMIAGGRRKRAKSRKSVGLMGEKTLLRAAHKPPTAKQKKVVHAHASERQRAWAALAKKTATPRKLRPVGAKKRKAASTVKRKAKKHTHGRKKARSAKQKAATRKLVALNRRKAHPRKRKAAKRKSHRKPAHHAKRRTHARKRKACRTRTFHPAPDSKRIHRHKHRVRGHIRRTNPSHHHNPKVSIAIELLLGAGLGVAASVGAQVAARTLMPDSQKLAGHVGAGLAVVAAVMLAKKRPILAGGLAAGAIAGDVAPMLSARVEMLTSPQGAKLGAIRLQGLEYIGAVQANTMGRVADAQSFRMGALQMGPYDMGGIQNTPGPFGY